MTDSGPPRTDLPPAESPQPVIAGPGIAPVPPGPPAEQAEIPEEAPEPPDRWAHRRAEPRPLAFMWTVYLFVATAMTFAAISGVGGLTLDVYRPALRILLATVAAGLVLVWPMIRLSQAGPSEHPAAASLKDWFAIVVPLQAIVWPQWLLAAWPVAVISRLAMTLTAWAVLSGGVMALFFRWEAGRGGGRGEEWRVEAGSRSWLMVFFVAAAGLGPAIGAVWSMLTSQGLRAPGPMTWWMLSSPLTAVFEVTRDGSDGSERTAVWAAAANVSVAGLVCWFWSAAGRRARATGVTSEPTSA